jgi:cyclic pyranopterin phosphate synthase
MSLELTAFDVKARGLVDPLGAVSRLCAMRRLPLLESRSAIYEDWPPRPADFDAIPILRDSRNRRYTYLRLSVTDRCDLACVYCMPPTGEDDHARRRELLTFEEAARLVSVFAAAGIERVRLTGGEPLVRKDIVRLVELIGRRTEVQLVMTTNATRLSELARPLHEAGLRGVNISIDTLDADRFRAITRGGDLGRVLAGIHAALDVGLEVKLNTVPLRGRNDDELVDIVEFAWSLGATPRFIELMPLGEGAKLPASMRMSADDVVSVLGARLHPTTPSAVAGHGPARYFDAADGSDHRVGFITPISDEFCDTCNRVRVTARGDIRACLASRRAINLRNIMRAGGNDLDLAWAMVWSLSGKDRGHYFLDMDESEHEHVGMSLIGG